MWASKEQLLKVKGYFESKGIATSSGLTTCVGEIRQEGFSSLCYSRLEGQESLWKVVTLKAEVFDEFIFDDFYFLNCRCKECIAQKVSSTWSWFQLDQKRQIKEKIMMKIAKEADSDSIDGLLRQLCAEAEEIIANV